MTARRTPPHERRRRLSALAASLAAALITLPAADALAGASRDTVPLGIPRTDHAATLLADGRVLVTGGASGFEPQVGAAEVFNPVTATWSPTAAMAAARSNHTAVLLGGTPCGVPAPPVWCGKVLVTGGATAELFTPGTGTWAPAGDPVTGRTRHTATALPDGRVLVSGGTAAGGALASAELYDPAANTWTATGSLATARLDHTATRLPDGRVLVAGGRGALATPLDTAELFTPATGIWTTGGTKRSGRFHEAASILPDGDVLVTGGFDGASPRTLVDRFDAVSGWAGPDATVPAMTTARSDHTATLLTTPGCAALCGRVLVAGGGSDSTADIFAAEVYNPVADTWAATGSLQTARSRHTATLLSPPGCAALCGRVLVAGGTNRARPTSSAELFDPAGAPTPARVSDLSATAPAADRVVLTFSAPASDGRAPPPARRYVVAQSVAPIADDGAFAAAPKLCGGVCVFSPTEIGQDLDLTVNGLAAATRYHFALRALGPGGTLGPRSNRADATTLGSPPARPGAIEDLSGRPLTPHSVRVTFRAPAEGGAGSGPALDYVVKRSRQPISGEAAFAAATSQCAETCTAKPQAVGGRTGVTLMNLTPNRLWYIALRARSDAGLLGPVSPTVRVRTPADRVRPGVVTGLRIRALSSGRVRLSFRVPHSDGNTGPAVRTFEIRQSRSPIRTARAFRLGRKLCRRTCRFSPPRARARVSLTVTGLCARTTYHYAIRARDAATNIGPRRRFKAVRTTSGSAAARC